MIILVVNKITIGTLISLLSKIFRLISIFFYSDYCSKNIMEYYFRVLSGKGYVLLLYFYQNYSIKLISSIFLISSTNNIKFNEKLGKTYVQFIGIT